MLALAVIGATPLVPLVFTGMKHALHAALCLLFLWRAALALAAEGGEIVSIDWLLLAPAMTATRFEGMFAIAAVCLLLLLRRRVRHAFVLAILGLLPIVAYAAFSVTQGSLPLPNSVLLKVQGPELGSVGGLVAYSLRWLTRLAHNPQLLVLEVAACVLFVASRPRQTAWTAPQFLEAAFVMVTLLHLQFAETGWFYRYEAYLVATGLVVTAIGASEVMSASGVRWGGLSVAQRVGVTAGLACFAAPLLQRANESVAQTPIAMANVHQQQYQMGRFVHSYYDGQAIAANDIAPSASWPTSTCSTCSVWRRSTWCGQRSRAATIPGESAAHGPQGRAHRHRVRQLVHRPQSAAGAMETRGEVDHSQ